LLVEAGAGAWIVNRAASTCYRPGVRPLYVAIEAGTEMPTVVKDLSIISARRLEAPHHP
jgi:hypothetical protein